MKQSSVQELDKNSSVPKLLVAASVGMRGSIKWIKCKGKQSAAFC